MRITLNIDDEVAKYAEEKARLDGETVEASLNKLLRSALPPTLKPVATPFRVEPIAMGLPPDVNYNHIEDPLDELEGPLYRSPRMR